MSCALVIVLGVSNIAGFGEKGLFIGYSDGLGLARRFWRKGPVSGVLTVRGHDWALVVLVVSAIVKIVRIIDAVFTLSILIVSLLWAAIYVGIGVCLSISLDLYVSVMN